MKRFLKRCALKPVNFLAPPPSGRPILVVGNGRSGTTWIGETLSYADGILYFREPCHPMRHGTFDDTIWSRYIPEGESDPYFERILERSFRGQFMAGTGSFADIPKRLRQSPRVLIKEVASYLSLRWISARWNPQTVLVVRHPCAYAQSVKKMNQDTEELSRFEVLRSNIKLQKDYLAPIRSHLETIRTPLEATAGSWAIRNYVNLRNPLPDWKMVRYEDFAQEPVGCFRDLYRDLSLQWDDQLESLIEKKTTTITPGAHSTSRVSKTRIGAWRTELTQAEIAAVRRVVEPFDLPVYADDYD